MKIIFLFAGILAAAYGCSNPEAANAVYETRGIVAQKGSGEERLVAVLHEAIPGFRNREGEVTGMQVMSMNFAVAPGVSLENIDPGSKIHFAFEVDWNASPRIKIIRLEKLPPETPLNLDGFSLE